MYNFVLLSDKKDEGAHVLMLDIRLIVSRDYLLKCEAEPCMRSYI